MAHENAAGIFIQAKKALFSPAPEFFKHICKLDT
jgi:hypothetical protein